MLLPGDWQRTRLARSVTLPILGQAFGDGFDDHKNLARLDHA
jgi:hypothetical protein